MAKRKNKAEQESTPIQESVEQPKRNNLPYLLVFALGFLLYANTIPFDYALDDKLYITSNSYTKKGFSGIGEIWSNDLMTGFFGTKKNLVEGGRYRPLALTTHAIEWELFKDNPQISHFINVVLYGLTMMILLSVLRRIFGWKEERWWLNIAFITTILYAAHPLHTEVAANIKSRDEIMSLLFALLSFRAALIFLDSRKSVPLILSGAWFLLSLFSKESSVTFLGVIPLTLIFFPKADLKGSITSLLPLVGATALYLIVRLAVFADQGASLEVAAELMNKPYLNASSDERLASIFFTMGLYLKLLVYPHPLTHDYYPFHPFRSFTQLEQGMNPYLDWSNVWSILSLLAYAAILGYGVWTLIQKLRGGKSSIIGYGLLIYFGTFILFSNLFFDIGAFMNERFLFIPSLGFALIAAYVLLEVISKRLGEKAMLGILTLLMISYSAKTISRNTAWESDQTLAMSDVQTSDGSAKVKMTMGSELLDMAKETANVNEKARLLKEAEKYELDALKIYPGYFPPVDILGNIYFEQGNYAYSVHYFTQAVKRKSGEQRLSNNLEAVGNKCIEVGDYESAEKALTFLAKRKKGKDLARIYSTLGEMYGKNLQDLQTSKRYLSKAIKANPNSASAYQKIGIVYAMTNVPDSAMFSFQRSLDIEPDNAKVLLNIAILYKQLNDIEKSNAYMARAMELDPSIQGAPQ